MSGSFAPKAVWSRMWRGVFWHRRFEDEERAFCGAKPGRTLVNRGYWRENTKDIPLAHLQCPKCRAQAARVDAVAEAVDDAFARLDPATLSTRRKEGAA